jgi:hypothetical protein
MYQSILFARGKTGKVKNDAMPPKVGRVASDGKRVFEPPHNDSPLSQNMDEPWAYVPPRYVPTSTQDWGQVLMFEGKSCSHFRAFTNNQEMHRLVRQLPRYSTLQYGNNKRTSPGIAGEFEELNTLLAVSPEEEDAYNLH